MEGMNGAMSRRMANLKAIREIVRNNAEGRNEVEDRIDQVLVGIALEVERAKQQWGEEFDRCNTLNDWATYVNIYLAAATRMGATFEEVETNLRKAAGLLINAIDMHKREGLAPRHYEGQARPVSLPEIQQ